MQPQREWPNVPKSETWPNSDSAPKRETWLNGLSRKQLPDSDRLIIGFPLPASRYACAPTSHHSAATSHTAYGCPGWLLACDISSECNDSNEDIKNLKTYKTNEMYTKRCWTSSWNDVCSARSKSIKSVCRFVSTSLYKSWETEKRSGVCVN